MGGRGLAWHPLVKSSGLEETAFFPGDGRAFQHSRGNSCRFWLLTFYSLCECHYFSLPSFDGDGPRAKDLQLTFFAHYFSILSNPRCDGLFNSICLHYLSSLIRTSCESLNQPRHLLGPG